MHVSQLLHNHLEKSCPSVNKASLKRVIKTAESLLSGGKLSLTSLGRALSGDALVKHKIKAVDRLLGHNMLYSQRSLFYKAVAEMVIGTKKSIEILVDWSPCGNRKQQLIRASLFHQSRSTVLYEEVHPETTNLKRCHIHKKFLDKLKAILPKDCQVTVITDAGFRCDWFSQVVKLGWDFKGRVRGNTQYLSGKNSWKQAISLYKEATTTPRFVGEVLLTKKNKLPCQLYLYKEKVVKKRLSKRVTTSSGKSKKYHKAEVERMRKKSGDPWLIVCSTPHRFQSSKKSDVKLQATHEDRA